MGQVCFVVALRVGIDPVTLVWPAKELVVNVLRLHSPVEDREISL